MTKMIVACFLMIGVLAFSTTAFQAEAPLGVPPLQRNQAGLPSAPAGNPVPYATTNCGTYTCPNDGTCCGNNTCCPSGYSLYCKNTNKCYTSLSAVQAACGNSYTVCYVEAK